jgi:hypothetical protein
MGAGWGAAGANILQQPAEINKPTRGMRIRPPIQDWGRIGAPSYIHRFGSVSINDGLKSIFWANGFSGFKGKK